MRDDSFSYAAFCGLANMEKGVYVRLKTLAASIAVLAGGGVLPCSHAQQAVLVSDGTLPPAGSQASGVTVDGSTISTGGINNIGAFSSSIDTSTQTTTQMSSIGQSSTTINERVRDPESYGNTLLTGHSAQTIVSDPHAQSQVSLTSRSFYIGTDLTGAYDRFTSISYDADGSGGIRIGQSDKFSGFAGLSVLGGTASVTSDVQAGRDVTAGRNVVAAGQVIAGAGVVANGRVENVADGVAPTDAVNVQQLNQAVGASGALVGQVQDLGRQVGNNRKIASSGTAIAMAAASVPALESDRRFGIGVGTGTYDGRSAISVAGAARISRNVQVKLNLGTGSNGKAAAGAGALFSW